MKKIYKIVITGGPCAGKTTAMTTIENTFSAKGYAVLRVPETATELITGGITPVNVGSEQFQQHLIKLQLYKEEMFVSAAKFLENDKILILLDRAAMDNKGYMEYDAFCRIISNINMTERELLARYDGVIHMETAAKASKDLYQLENNQARFETVDEAIKTDDDLYAAWKDHPDFYSIKSDTDFVKKISNLTEAIKSILKNKE